MFFSPIILAAFDDLGSGLVVFLREKIVLQLRLGRIMLSLGVSLSSSNKVSEAENRGSLCALASSRYGPLEVRLMDSSEPLAMAGATLDCQGFCIAAVSTMLGMNLQRANADVAEGLCIVGLSVMMAREFQPQKG